MITNPVNIRRFGTQIFILILAIAVGLVSSKLILGASYIKLANAPVLYGQIAQSLIIGTGANKVLIVKNYAIKDQEYIDNGSWVIAQFNPQGNQGDNNSVVMQKVGPFYEVVLGPGSAFPNYLQYGLPFDVYQDMVINGLIYEPNN